MEKVKEVTHKAKDAMTGHHTSSHPTTQPSTHEGPHRAGLANQVDPRVDSDRDASHNLGMASQGGNAYPATHQQTHVGPHSSGLANQADPRVDSDLDGSRNYGAATGHGVPHNTGYPGGTGYTSGTNYPAGTAGPHSSNLANKVDPRVDSDVDGSRNMGLASGNTYTTEEALPDASKHSPSVFAKMTGGAHPEVSHAGDPHDHRRRHSLKGLDTAETLGKYGSGK